MKRPLLLTLIAALPWLWTPGLSRANATEVGIERPVGLGLSAGSVPGLTLKVWMRPTAALDFGVGFGTGSFACTDRVNFCDRRASLNSDYLFQSGHQANDRFSGHVGFGARFWFWSYQTQKSDLRLAARMPLGVDLYLFKWLELYGEVVPSLAINPSVIFLEGALGARMYI